LPGCAEESASAGLRSVEELAAALEVLEFTRQFEFVVKVAAAAAIERDAAALGATALVMGARLMQADLWYRRGDMDAVGVASEIHQWAAEHKDLVLLAASHSLLQQISDHIGDPAAALDHALGAVELLEHVGAPPMRRVRYLMRLGIALSDAMSFEDARERYNQALQLATAIEDVQIQIDVLTNIASNEMDAGEPQRSLEVAETMAALAGTNGIVLDLVDLSHLARAYIGVGRYAEAERLLLAGLEDDLPHVQLNDQEMVLRALAEAQRRLGAFDRASVSLQRSQQICDERGLVWDKVQIKRELAELHAAQGQFKQAYETYQIYHAESEAHHATERAAQARARQAMFETTEARQQAQLYHEQARRDPLTGLHNRRHVEEQLPALIERSTRDGDPLIIALVDLDDFKRVNDTHSHDTGDQVLITVAGLLAAAIPRTTEAATGGFAARIGGEEFLLVLTGMSATDAVHHLDDLRRGIAAHPWQPITGDLPVTVSIGVSAAQPASTQTTIFARADESLYAAKNDGRNRVHVDPTIDLTERRQYRDGLPANSGKEPLH
jgi:diguanylate cyclase (GGDEF)-like protein